VPPRDIIIELHSLFSSGPIIVCHIRAICISGRLYALHVVLGGHCRCVLGNTNIQLPYTLYEARLVWILPLVGSLANGNLMVECEPSFLEMILWPWVSWFLLLWLVVPSELGIGFGISPNLSLSSSGIWDIRDVLSRSRSRFTRVILHMSMSFHPSHRDLPSLTKAFEITNVVCIAVSFPSAMNAGSYPVSLRTTVTVSNCCTISDCSALGLKEDRRFRHP